LSNSEFAEKIGVAKSGLSHILSGRNKASLDYVVKIISAFPDLNIKWLLLGEQPMIISNSHSENIGLKSKSEKEDDSKLLDEDLIDYKSKQKNELTSQQMVLGEADKTNDGKSIEKIVFFFDDSSFKVYKSENSS
jgi:transcriptional regulator with XRE-family HTH domain